MASALIRRFGWPVAAAACFAFLVIVAFHGGRRDPLMEFQAAGILTAFAPDAVREVRIVAAATTLVFDRAGSWDDRIDPALRLLHDAAPLRVLTATEVAQVPASEYAFDADSLHVSIGAAGGASFEVEFGGRNPLGSGRYARVGGVQDVFLLPAYVAEAWEKVLR